MRTEKFCHAELTVLYFRNVLKETTVPGAACLDGIPDINTPAMAKAVVEVLLALQLPKGLSDLRHIAIEQLERALTDQETVSAVA